MQVNSGDGTRSGEMIDALIRALNLVVAEASLSDRQRDEIVTEIERAMASASTKTFATSNDGLVLERLENLVLQIRVKGASATEPGHGVGGRA